MARYLREETLLNTDEAWLVVDKDQWTDEQLKQLHAWAQSRPNYNLALSNPKFEFWLLLHFEDGQGISNSRTCSEKLKRYLPDYDKDFDIKWISSEKLDHAIQRAKQLDNPPCPDWPKRPGSTVYRLVENIISATSLK